MTLFVLGAGATRACSFVDASKSPCIPPLDADFFTQLQRVRNPKHQSLINVVVKDVDPLLTRLSSGASPRASGPKPTPTASASKAPSASASKQPSLFPEVRP